MKKFITLILIFVLVQVVYAQDTTVTVPDVTGLNPPQAAAMLNSAGLNFGTATVQDWTAESGFAVNTVNSQSIPAGESAARGAIVDVTVLRSTNALLIYDDNDITLINQSEAAFALSGVTFASTTSAAMFNAGRWSATLASGDCGQLWSVGRNSAKDVPGCGATLWLTTNDSTQHFWTGGNTQFAVMQDGIQRGVCEVSAGQCNVYLANDASAETTAYIYLAYTPDRFLIFNNSSDKWMSLNGVLATGIGLANSPLVADISLFDSQDVVGNIQQLAPGQCVYYTNNADGAAPLQPCDEIARASVNLAPPIFWNGELTIQSASDGGTAICPAATEGRLTVCIVPR